MVCIARRKCHNEFNKSFFGAAVRWIIANPALEDVIFSIIIANDSKLYSKGPMVLQRETDIRIIIERCSILRNVIEDSSALNLTSINVISENFFRDLLNLLLGTGLENLNATLDNAAAIDLGDDRTKLCVQVTATSGKPKIAKTVNTFAEHDLQNKYDRLVVFVATKKKNYQADFISDKHNKHILDLKRDVWDWTDVYRLAKDLKPSKLTELRKFIEENIVVDAPKNPIREVATFIDLMQILSDETHSEAGKGVLTEPDPDKKIEKRFSAHSGFLLDEYGKYYAEYGAVLEETLIKGELGAARMRRLGLHLGTKSDELLTDNKNDPQKALDALVHFYLSALQESGKNSDQGAIRFFMLYQMIRCYVFPNEGSGIG